MSLPLDQILKASGFASLDELKAKLASGVVGPFKLMNVMELVFQSAETATALEDGVIQLASDMTEESEQKKAKKRLLEMAMTMGIQRELEQERGFGIPDKADPSKDGR